MVPPFSSELIDRTGTLTVATTDPKSHTVYLSKDLTGEFLARVLIHELGHCAMISFGLIEEIRDMVPPENWVQMEEFCCNLIADYGYTIYSDAYHIIGDQALYIIPQELEKVIS